MTTECIERNLEVNGEETFSAEESDVCEGDGTTCVECSKVFTHSFYFSTHIGTHVDHKGYVAVGQCTFCGLVFSDEQKFNNHMISAQSRQEKQVMSEDDVSTELTAPDIDPELSSQSKDNCMESHEDGTFSPDQETTIAEGENAATTDVNSSTINEEKPKRKRKAPDRFVPNQKVPSTSLKIESDPEVEAYLSSLAEMGLTVDPEAFSNHKNAKKQKKANHNGYGQDKNEKGSKRRDSARGTSSDHKQSKKTSKGQVYMDIADDEPPKEASHENVYMDIADDEPPKEASHENVYLDIADDEPLKKVGQQNVYLGIADDEPLKKVGQQNVYLDIADDGPLKKVGQQNVYLDIADDEPLKKVGQQNVYLDIADDEPLKKVGQQNVCLDIADDEPPKEIVCLDIADEELPKKIIQENVSLDIADEELPKEISQENVCLDIANDELKKEISQENVSSDIADDELRKEISQENLSVDIELSKEIAQENVCLDIEVKKEISQDNVSLDIEVKKEISQDNVSLDIEVKKEINQDNVSLDIADEGLSKEIIQENVSLDIADDDDLPKEISQESVLLELSESPVDDLEVLLEKLEQQNDKLGQINQHGRVTDTSHRVRHNVERTGQTLGNIPQAGPGFGNKTITAKLPKAATPATATKGTVPTISSSRTILSPSSSDKNKPWHASNIDKTNNPMSPQASQIKVNTFAPSYLSQGSGINTTKTQSTSHFGSSRNNQHNGSFTPPVTDRPSFYRPQTNNVSNHEQTVFNHQLGRGNDKNEKLSNNIGVTNVQKSSSLEDLKKDSRENVVEMLQSIGMIALTSTSLIQKKMSSSQKSTAKQTSLPPNKRADVAPGWNNMNHAGGGMHNRSLNTNKTMVPQQPQFKRNQVTFGYEPSSVARGQGMSYGGQNHIRPSPQGFRGSSVHPGQYPQGTGYVRGLGTGVVRGHGTGVVRGQGTGAFRGQHMGGNMRGPMFNNPGRGMIRPMTRPEHASGQFRGQGATNYINRQAKPRLTSNEIIVIDDEDTIGKQANTINRRTNTINKQANTINKQSNPIKKQSKQPHSSNEIIVIDEDDDDIILVSAGDSNKADPTLGKNEPEKTVKPDSEKLPELEISNKEGDVLEEKFACSLSDIKTITDTTYESITAAPMEVDSGLILADTSCPDASLDDAESNAQVEDHLSPAADPNKQRRKSIDSVTDACLKTEGNDLCDDNNLEDKDLCDNTIEENNENKIMEDNDPCDNKIMEDNDPCDNKMEEDNSLCNSKIEDNEPCDNKIKEDSDICDNKIVKDNDLCDSKADSEGNESDTGLNDNVDILPGEDIDGWKVCLAEESDSEDGCAASSSVAQKLSSHDDGPLASEDSPKQDHCSSSIIDRSHMIRKNDDPLSYLGCENMESQTCDKPSSPQAETYPESPYQDMCSPQHQILSSQTFSKPSPPRDENNPEQHMCSPQHQTRSNHIFDKPSSLQTEISPECPEQHMGSPQNTTLASETFDNPSSLQKETSPEQHMCSPQHTTLTSETLDNPSSPQTETNPESPEQHMCSPQDTTLASETFDNPSSPQTETSPEQHMFSPQHTTLASETFDNPSSPETETSPDQNVCSPQHTTFASQTFDNPSSPQTETSPEQNVCSPLGQALTSPRQNDPPLLIEALNEIDCCFLDSSNQETINTYCSGVDDNNGQDNSSQLVCSEMENGKYSEKENVDQNNLISDSSLLPHVGPL